MVSNYCVMVKGPCKGRKCDFWARVRIRKKSTDELVEEARTSIQECDRDDINSKNQAMTAFWSQLGIKDMDELCEEEPDLCEKIRYVEESVLGTL